MKYCLKKC